MLGVGPRRAAVLAILGLLVVVALVLVLGFSTNQACGQADQNLLVFQTCMSAWRDQFLAALAAIALVVSAGLAVIVWRRKKRARPEPE